MPSKATSLATRKVAKQSLLTPAITPRRCSWLWSKRVCVSRDRKSTRLNSSHQIISYAVFCLKKKRILRPKQNPVHCISRFRSLRPVDLPDLAVPNRQGRSQFASAFPNLGLHHTALEHFLSKN